MEFTGVLKPNLKTEDLAYATRTLRVHVLKVHLVSVSYDCGVVCFVCSVRYLLKVSQSV